MPFIRKQTKINILHGNKAGEKIEPQTDPAANIYCAILRFETQTVLRGLIKQARFSWFSSKHDEANGGRISVNCDFSFVSNISVRFST